MTMTVERAARAILARNGAADPHPDLLADTIREVEYHGIPDDIAALDTPVDAPGWTIEKQQYEMPCEHVACDLMHRHLYNGSYDRRTLITVYNMLGDEIGTRWESRYHSRKVTSWAVVDPDGYGVESFDTLREARENFPRLSGEPAPK